ncbi:hypothetical protein chiPu_0009249 [Chiloscyllium punctatum]|uniref:Uncharacterized protein n=1 Tax=Chiloscyllium punctatum TaxID=137246 RepID=A0A401SK91_CHIPU|nr:hypothetical protein [Chiloscyllium punctatum]
MLRTVCSDRVFADEALSVNMLCVVIVKCKLAEEAHSVKAEAARCLLIVRVPFSSATHFLNFARCPLWTETSDGQALLLFVSFSLAPRTAPDVEAWRRRLSPHFGLQYSALKKSGRQQLKVDPLRLVAAASSQLFTMHL